MTAPSNRREPDASGRSGRPTASTMAAAALMLAVTVAGCGGDKDSTGTARSQPLASQSSLRGSSETDEAVSARGSEGSGGPSVAPGFGSAAPVDDGSRTMDCGDVIDAISSPPSEFSIVASDIALPTRVQLQASRNTNIPASDPQAYFAKYGLLVRVGVAVDLALAPNFADEAAIGWGTGEPGLVVHVPACSAHGNGVTWLAFAGGYYVNTPRCLPVEVHTPSGRESVSIGAGAPCPGQSAAQPAA
ncbi:hypothetical protein [Pseudofrankia sp. BMG5.36]|uniref:hypothetical protein n=1 Tax=Pseudofrankia sp. BMG5.36 TaxID=1834512 RepID=UPI0008DA2F91|nr:hypothetical protein [Pseudofrankia sp. BMG5.36]OHV66820.1 hypothetical protein BCD48_35620 [Pseudofrankia sp. BMG5.36]